MMYHFHTLLKIILALSFLALNAVADDSSLIDVQAQGNQIIASGWTLDEGSTNEPGLQQASDLPPPVVNNESPLLSDEKDCADLQRRAAPGKLKRLRFAKREQQLSCPFQEFSGPSAREQPIPPPGGSEFNPDRKTRPTTMKKLINEKLLRPIVDVSVCGFQEGLDIPICAPRSVKSPYASVLLLHPCRFWRLEDECEDLIEDLWCCKSAYVDRSPGWRMNVLTQRYFSTAEVCRRVQDAHIHN